MTQLERIYSDDPLLKYKDTYIPAPRTKAQIDGVLAEYGVKTILWEWNKDLIDNYEEGTIYVGFKLEEIINGVLVRVSVRVDAPIIWDKPKPRGRPPTPERVNWRISMRAMYHFIYTHLNSSYAMRSGKVVAFLGYVQSGENQQVKDLIIPRLKEYRALEDQSSTNNKERITVTTTEFRREGN